jgi:hypothetical protein
MSRLLQIEDSSIILPFEDFMKCPFCNSQEFKIYVKEEDLWRFCCEKMYNVVMKFLDEQVPLFNYENNEIKD